MLAGGVEPFLKTSTRTLPALPVRFGDGTGDAVHRQLYEHEVLYRKLQRARRVPWRFSWMTPEKIQKIIKKAETGNRHAQDKMALLYFTVSEGNRSLLKSILQSAIDKPSPDLLKACQWAVLANTAEYRPKTNGLLTGSATGTTESRIRLVLTPGAFLRGRSLARDWLRQRHPDGFQRKKMPVEPMPLQSVEDLQRLAGQGDSYAQMILTVHLMNPGVYLGLTTDELAELHQRAKDGDDSAQSAFNRIRAMAR